MVEKAKKFFCKYGCGAEYPHDEKGQIALMNHYKECPNSPKVKEKREQKETRDDSEDPANEEKPQGATVETKRQPFVSSESIPSMTETLERIIREISQSKKIPGVIRHVQNYLDNPRKSFEELSNIMTMADFPPMDRKVILKNWGTYLKLGDTEKLIENEIKDEDQKKDEKEKEEKKTPAERLEEGIKQAYEAEYERLKILQIRKQIKDMERELEGPKSEPKKEEEEKQLLIVDGVSLKLTASEMLGWKKYISEEKDKTEERERRKEEQKIKDAERSKKQDSSNVQWPVGDKVIEVRPETIPLLMMQQSQKKDDDPLMKALLEEMKATREQFHAFQLQTLEKKINDLEVYATQDPLEKLFNQKKKLEELGLVSSSRLTAQERLYDMDRKKLDTLLQIVVDKSVSTQGKVDSLLHTIGPSAQEYLKEMILQMKQNRGAVGQEVARTAEQAQETLKNLEAVDKAFDATGAAASKVVNVGQAGGA